MSPGRFRALVFDLDGTVVDSHRFTFEAFRHACAPSREPPTDAEVFQSFGPSERVILARLVPPAALENAYVRLQEYYAAHASALGMHQEMRPLLEACRAARIPCGLFTGRGTDSTRLLLATLDLAWAFDAVVAGDQASQPKPAPDGVLQLVAAIGCDTATTLVVGDSALDVDAARAAGAEAVFASWHAWAGSTPPRGTLVLAHPDALRPLVGLPPVAAADAGTAPV